MNMRESFEAWMQSRYPEYPLDVELGNCGRPDSYTWTVVHQMWQAWQASRAAIVLPESTGGYIAGEYGNGYADALHEVKQAIGVDVP